MRVSTPAEMTTIDVTVMSNIVRIFEYELHEKEKNLSKYEVHINIPDRLKAYVCDELFSEITKMYVSVGWDKQTNIKYLANKGVAFLNLYK